MTETATSSSPKEGAAAAVAGAIVDACLAQLRAGPGLPALLSRLLREGLLLYLRSPRADASVRELVLTGQRFLNEHGRATLGELLPAEAVKLLRTLANHPYTPERRLLLSVLSREPFRRWSRELMVGMLLDYSRRLGTSVASAGMGKGLGALGRLATEAVKKSTSAIGSIAPGMTSAVTDELERQMQRRTAEFADGAIDDLLQRVAATLTDPARAAEHTAMKRALLECMLETSGSQVAQELVRLEPATVAAELRAASLAWLSCEQAEAELGRLLAWLVEQAPEGTFAAVAAVLRPFLASALHPIVVDGTLARLSAPQAT